MILSSHTKSNKFSKRKLRKMFACGWTSLVKASRLDIDDIIVHYKTRRKNVEIPECRKKIIDFYVKDNISRQLPYKNFTIRVKDENEIYQREAIRGI